MNRPQPPIPVKKPRKFSIHGDTRVDEYAWLKDMADPAVKEHFKAENAYAEGIMRSAKPLANALYKEIRARVTEDDMSVPVKDGPFLYYTRVRKGKQYAQHCRKPLKYGREEIFLDENMLAKGHSFFALGASDVSPDHLLLAYTTDTTGNEHFTMRIKNLATGKHLSEKIESVSAVVWAEDGAHLFYTKENHPFPPRQVWRHRVGTEQSEDVLLFEEKDPQWYVHIDKSRSRKFVFITAANFDATEVRYIPADLPLTTPRLIASRAKRVKYSAEHWGDSFCIVTNERAVNYKIMRAPIASPDKKHWKPWLPYDPKRAITGLAAFRDFIVVAAREKGSEWLYVARGTNQTCVSWHQSDLCRIPLPEGEHTIGFWDDLEFESPFVRFTYGSFLTPKTVFDYDVATKKLSVKKRQKVPGWHAVHHLSERIWVKSSGGALVPVSLAYSKNVKKDGTAPILLSAYGSYGITSDPYFSIAALSLLKRGWVVAIAHPRGGGEMGWSWHEAAKKTTKHRTYEDVIAAADALITKKYGSRERLVITGGSAGGMTMGAVMNMRPDLCRAAMVYVPNADTVSSMLDTTLGGTLLHYDELGDPRKRAEYRYLKRWSPYENVKKGVTYPAILVRASQHDIRTPAWEAAKWVARLRDRGLAKGNSGNHILFKIETSAGHAGKSGRYEWIKEKAWDYAWMLTSVRCSA